MKVDVDRSQHHESPTANDEFDNTELQNLRFLLRRLRFLEQQIRENGGMADGRGSGGAVFAVLEHDALEFVLGPDGVNFLADK